MDDKKEAVVTTQAGKIEGTYESGLFVFKGVPYAAPPVGELRWMPPQPVKPWEGMRPVKQFEPIAPQNPLPGGIIIHEPQPQNEDCLYLNIWTKGLDDAKRPVMVWIHGGAFIIGSGTEVMYTDGKLASYGDVVLVTINYRLGATGFMNLDVVTDGKITASGNEGLLDQVAAIEWVHENIAAFGGDPENITVFGESAGGMSIGTLMSMPAARDKFPKAILESGAANTVSDLAEAVYMSQEYLKVLGLTGKDVDALRALTTKQLMEAQQRLGDIMREKEHRITPFQPLVDGRVIPERPIEAIRKGSANNVTAIIGTNLEEWTLFAIMEPGFKDISEGTMLDRLSGMLPDQPVEGLVNDYRNALAKRGKSPTPADILTAIQTDIMFRMPAINVVEAQRDNGRATYNYLFTWKSPAMGGAFGACHALEIGFIFGEQDPMLGGKGPDVEKLTRCMQDAWLSFAYTGNPSCESIGKWPVYGNERMTMILDKDCRIEAAPYDAERIAWDRINLLFTKPI